MLLFQAAHISRVFDPINRTKKPHILSTIASHRVTTGHQSGSDGSGATQQDLTSCHIGCWFHKKLQSVKTDLTLSSSITSLEPTIQTNVGRNPVGLSPTSVGLPPTIVKPAADAL
jgi:hypothetical protein